MPPGCTSCGMKAMLSLQRNTVLWAFLIGIGLIRLLAMDYYPLMDTTEARYGEIARLMVETNNWITPYIDYDTPFWGKPPLYTWVSALSIVVFGNSEFSLRLPHLLAAVLVLILVWQFAKPIVKSSREAIYAVMIVATSAGFYMSAGVIMTDMLLCLSMTMAMVGFWRSWHGESKFIYLLYPGIGIGLMVKGPLILVLVGLALLPWIIIECGIKNMWAEIWQRLHVVFGLFMITAISAPWYYLAEQATPGFLEYFFIGEHLQRFIESGWQGDLYGSGHSSAKGTIWLFWFVLALPWSPLLIWLAAKNLSFNTKLNSPLARINVYLLLWLSSPMLMFTMASNTLPAYVLPGLPALGMLIALNFNCQRMRLRKSVFLFAPVVFMMVIAYLNLFEDSVKSEKKLLENRQDSNADTLYYKKRPFSAQYYSDGKAQKIRKLPGEGQYYLVVDKAISLKEANQNCEFISDNRFRNLYYCRKIHL